MSSEKFELHLVGKSLMKRVIFPDHMEPLAGLEVKRLRVIARECRW